VSAVTLNCDDVQATIGGYGVALAEGVGVRVEAGVVGAVVARSVGARVSDGEAVAAGCDVDGVGVVAGAVAPQAETRTIAPPMSSGYPSLRLPFTGLTPVERQWQREVPQCAGA
jgi:hypothetical protein